MVQAVRSGKSIRDVAVEFGVTKTTVERWKRRTGEKRLDRVDWTNQPDGPPRPANRSSEEVEQCVLAIRKRLKEESVLGEHGADAILREFQCYGNTAYDLSEHSVQGDDQPNTETARSV